MAHDLDEAPALLTFRDRSGDDPKSENGAGDHDAASDQKPANRRDAVKWLLGA
jgi:hypothetical protein